MKYLKNKRYQLYADEIFQTNIRPAKTITTDYAVLNTDGRLLIYKRFAWDGSSGPVTIQTKWCKNASLKHDVLCKLVQDGHLPKDRKTKELVDLEYYLQCREDNMPWIMAEWRLRFIRIYNWNVEKKEKVYEV